MQNNSADLLCYEEKIIDELYTINSLVEVLRFSCFSKEMNFNYTNEKELFRSISVERNDYINILTLLSEKITEVINLNYKFQNKITNLQNYSNNCSRQVATQSTTN